ncbi:hypothetical protein [Natronoglycomyces albus]|uniref:Uncharacterized protein n=1 Tax=Natronoglycomyces albus TaxID=2811108 RepID=A0A895XNZ4_9ACTN|nr:hypothetical protein [Natronoglycomyces albus]QSB05263.1 hypothetical protein JQS30_16160 [Natronoglycomyces albus]
MRRWWGQLAASSAIVALTVALAMGVPLLNKAISSEVDVTGESFRLSPGVTVTAPPGTEMRPGFHQPQQGRAEFSINSATVAVEAQAPYHFSADYLIDEMERLIAAQPGVHMAEDRACQAGQIVGAGRSFLTASGSGFLCAFVYDGVRVEVTASGTALDSETVEAIERLIDSLDFGGAA